MFCIPTTSTLQQCKIKHLSLKKYVMKHKIRLNYKHDRANAHHKVFDVLVEQPDLRLSTFSTLGIGNSLSSGSSSWLSLLCSVFTCFHTVASSCTTPSSVSWVALILDSISLSEAGRKLIEHLEHLKNTIHL